MVVPKTCKFFTYPSCIVGLLKVLHGSKLVDHLDGNNSW